MPTKPIDTIMAFISLYPRSAWSDEVLKLIRDGQDLQGLSDLASQLSVIAAEVSEYLGERHGYGSGDQGDEKAWKQVAKRKKKVRRALGYSYP